MADDPVIENLRADLAGEGLKALIDTRMHRFRQPQLTDALAFWRTKTGPEGIPFRREFTPQAMRPFLHRVALFEAVEQATATYRLRARLTGREFAKTYAEMSGKYVDEIVPKKFLKRWTLVWDAIVSYRRPFRCISVPEAFNRDHSVIEYLAAPLLDDAGVLNQGLLVCNFEFGGSWESIFAEEASFLSDPSGSKDKDRPGMRV